MDEIFAGLQEYALIYALALFGLGAAENFRYGLLLAVLSVIASLAVAQLGPGNWNLFFAQVGLFVGVTMLRLLASAMFPTRPRAPERVSASHSNAASDGPLDGEDFARGLLSMFVAGAVLIAPLAIIAMAAGRVDERVWQFFLITGMLGFAIVLMVLWPFIAPLLHVLVWLDARRVRRNREGNQ